MKSRAETSARQIRRKLFTVAAGVSAVLCVGVCVLWVRKPLGGMESEWNQTSV